MMVGIEMNLVKMRGLTRVDHGFAQSFSIASFPISPIVAVGQISNNKSCPLYFHSYMVINQAGFRLFLYGFELEAARSHRFFEMLVINSVHIFTIERHRHKRFPTRDRAPLQLLEELPAIERKDCHDSAAFRVLRNQESLIHQALRDITQPLVGLSPNDRALSVKIQRSHSARLWVTFAKPPDQIFGLFLRGRKS